MDNYTKDLLHQVELADDDKFDTDYNTKVFAKSVLSLLPDELIQYAIWDVSHR